MTMVNLVIDLLLSSLQNGKPACIIPLSVFSRARKGRRNSNEGDRSGCGDESLIRILTEPFGHIRGLTWGVES